HHSDVREIPFRMYETTALGSLFLTDPLEYSVERFFDAGTEYLTYRPGFGDLEQVLDSVLSNPARWNAIRSSGKLRAQRYTWPEIAEAYVAPALRELLRERAESESC